MPHTGCRQYHQMQQVEKSITMLAILKVLPLLLLLRLLLLQLLLLTLLLPLLRLSYMFNCLLFRATPSQPWTLSEWVWFNGTSTQFRSSALSLTRKAGTESTTVKESRRYINLANAIYILRSPTSLEHQGRNFADWCSLTNQTSNTKRITGNKSGSIGITT